MIWQIIGHYLDIYLNNFLNKISKVSVSQMGIFGGGILYIKWLIKQIFNRLIDNKNQWFTLYIFNTQIVQKQK